MKLKRKLSGGEQGRDVKAVQRALNKAPSSTTIEVTSVYEGATEVRMRAFRRAHKLPAGTFFDQAALDALDEWFDAYSKFLYRTYRVPPHPLSKVGPVERGGKSLLDLVPTHPTTGIPLFVAVDTVWGNAGNVDMIAPEDMEVDTRDSDASPGEGFYATGASLLRYWIGHLRESDEWPLGHKFRKGDFIGKTIPIPGNSDHGHWGVNGEHYLGKGKQFRYGRTGNGPPYTTGSPTYREQLEQASL